MLHFRKKMAAKEEKNIKEHFKHFAAIAARKI